MFSFYLKLSWHYLTCARILYELDIWKLLTIIHTTTNHFYELEIHFGYICVSSIYVYVYLLFNRFIQLYRYHFVRIKKRRSWKKVWLYNIIQRKRENGSWYDANQNIFVSGYDETISNELYDRNKDFLLLFFQIFTYINGGRIQDERKKERKIDTEKMGM